MYKKNIYIYMCDLIIRVFSVLQYNQLNFRNKATLLNEFIVETVRAKKAVA